MSVGRPVGDGTIEDHEMTGQPPPPPPPHAYGVGPPPPTQDQPWQWAAPEAGQASPVPPTSWGSPLPPSGTTRRTWVIVAIVGGAITVLLLLAVAAVRLAASIPWDEATWSGSWDEEPVGSDGGSAARDGVADGPGDIDWEMWWWTVGPDGELASVDLEEGSCATLGWFATSLREIDCARPHDFEIYLVGELDLDTPGVSVDEAAADVCEPAFASYVGAAYSRSEYDYTAFVPDDGRLDAGEREVICAVQAYEIDDALTGSVAGSRR